MELDCAKEIVSAWAETEQIINTVYFFGSRVNSTNNSASDLDIAVEIRFTDPNDALAHWLFNCDCWKSQLSTKLPWPVDLQFLDYQPAAIVTKAIERNSLLVYKRNANTLNTTI
jgi:predicted nucleotidyltransferase